MSANFLKNVNKYGFEKFEKKEMMGIIHKNDILSTKKVDNFHGTFFDKSLVFSDKKNYNKGSPVV